MITVVERVDMVVLKCAWMEGGAPSVTPFGKIRMRELHAGNLDSHHMVRIILDKLHEYTMKPANASAARAGLLSVSPLVVIHTYIGSKCH